MIQQDLIGFFNSVPHSRICSALQLTLCRLQEHFGQPAEDLAFQGGPQNRHQKPANVQATAKIPRIQHQGAADPTCHGADRVPCVAVCVLQSRVGYLLSDTRSMHGITTGTFVLLRSFRYADNRCFFLCRSELQTDWASLLFRLDFYGLPIELEHVPGEELLRSITSMQQGTITMQQPTCQ